MSHQYHTTEHQAYYEYVRMMLDTDTGEPDPSEAIELLTQLNRLRTLEGHVMMGHLLDTLEVGEMDLYAIDDIKVTLGYLRDHYGDNSLDGDYAAWEKRAV